MSRTIRDFKASIKTLVTAEHQFAYSGSTEPIDKLLTEVGQQTYQEVLTAINSGVNTALKKGVEGLKTKVKDEWGNRGWDIAIKHVRPWLDRVVRDIGTHGLSSEALSKQLDGIVTEFSVETEVKPDVGDELLGVETTPIEETGTEAPEVSADQVEELTEEEVLDLLGQPETAPTGSDTAPAEQPKAAAKTVGSLKREFVRRRQQNLVTGMSVEDLRKVVEQQLQILVS